MAWNPFGVIGAGISRLGGLRTQPNTFGHARTLTTGGNPMGPVSDPRVPQMQQFLASHGRTGLPPYAGYAGAPMPSHNIGGMIQMLLARQGHQPGLMPSAPPNLPQNPAIPQPTMPQAFALMPVGAPIEPGVQNPPQMPAPYDETNNTLGGWLKRSARGSY